jgi:hypothetical protein
MHRCHLVTVLLLASAAPAASQSIDVLRSDTRRIDTFRSDTVHIDTLAIRGHTRFLADDLLEGRGTGTVGERIAAAYIVSQAKRLGLVHLPGTGSFILPVPLRAADVHPETRVAIHAGSDTVVFRSGDDFVVNTGGAGAFRDFGGHALYWGDPERAARLLAAGRPPAAGPVPLAGSVAVFDGPLGAAALEIVPALGRAGVAGVVLLVPDTAHFSLFVRSRGGTRYFVDAAVDDPVWQPDLPVLLAGPRMAATLFAGVHGDAGVRGDAGAWPYDLGRSVAARIAVTTRDVPAANVAAMLPGSDLRLRDEFVVFTAHFDHLGIGIPDAYGDSIYSGFSDNAAGVAMLLAMAETLRDAPPARSVLFLFFTGEERGLLGSSYFAAAPPVPLERVRAVINLDAGAPPVPPVSWRVAGGHRPPGQTTALGAVARSVAADRGWSTTLTAAGPNSDHWPFLHRGVPAIFIIPGEEWEDTTGDERIALRERWDRYHQPGDRWFADFPFSGLRRYAEYALLVGLRVANAP